MKYYKISKSILVFGVMLCTIFACTTRDDEYTPPGDAGTIPFIIIDIVESPDLSLRKRVGGVVRIVDGSATTTNERNWTLSDVPYEIVSGSLTSKILDIKPTGEGELAIGLTTADGQQAQDTIQVLPQPTGSFIATPVDPDTGQPINPESIGFEFDPSTKLIVLEAGTTVRFTETTTELDTFSWSFPDHEAPDATPLTDPSFTFTFKKQGVSPYFFRGSAGSPFGEIAIPTTAQIAASEFDKFPVIVVKPSSKPLEIAGDFTETEDETIRLPYNNELEPLVDQNGFFTVRVNGVEFPIDTVSLNADDASVVEIKLTDPIYRPDDITISYDGLGTLQSTTGSKASAFSNIPVVMHDVNLWNDDIYGFEDQTESTMWVNVVDGGAAGQGTIEYSTEQAASGMYSMKITSLEGETFARASGSNHRADLEAGKTYIITYKVWLPSSPVQTATSFGPWLFWEGGSQQYWKNFAHPKDQWVTFTEEQLIGTSGTAYFTLRVSNGAIIYLDDVKIQEKEVRP